MKPLRIALVVPGISRAATGPAVWISELSVGLCDAGHQVVVIAGEAPGGNSGESRVAMDPRVELVLFPARSRLLWRVHYNSLLRNWLRANLACTDIVDIQGVWSFTAVHAARACLSAGVPYVLTPHGQMAPWDWNKKYWRKRAFFELLAREVWEGAVAIHFVTDGEKNCLMKGSQKPASVIPYWTKLASGDHESNARPSVRARLKIPEDGRLLMFLGRISAQKGVLEVLLAFDRIWRRRPELFLAIVGPQDSRYGVQVRQLIDQLPGKANISVLGPVYDQDKYDLLSAASLFITLSKNEGQPIAVLEAMACGTPVLPY